MININDESVTLVIDDRVVATARYSLHATANGRGAWIVSTDRAPRLAETTRSRP
jgi:hypothetical protein